MPYLMEGSPREAGRRGIDAPPVRDVCAEERDVRSWAVLWVRIEEEELEVGEYGRSDVGGDVVPVEEEEEEDEGIT